MIVTMYRYNVTDKPINKPFTLDLPEHSWPLKTAAQGESCVLWIVHDDTKGLRPTKLLLLTAGVNNYISFDELNAEYLYVNTFTLKGAEYHLFFEKNNSSK